MYQKLSSKDIAKKLGIAPSTARQWANRFNVPKQNHGKKTTYTKEALDVLMRVKDMRSKGNGYNTIQKLLDVKNISSTADKNSDASLTQQDLENTVQTVIDKALKENGSLSEKYARATFEIGQLQERVKHLEEKLESKEDEIKLLPAALEYEKLKMRTESQQSELESKNKLIKELQKQLNFEQSKPWWKKFF